MWDNVRFSYTQHYYISIPIRRKAAAERFLYVQFYTHESYHSQYKFCDWRLGDAKRWLFQTKPTKQICFLK